MSIFDKWLKSTQKTAVYPDEFTKDLAPIVYTVLGFAGEAGEVADQIKKVIRNDDGKLTEERLEKIKLELGDCGWYWLRLIFELGFTVEEVMEANLKKLNKRYKQR